MPSENRNLEPGTVLTARHKKEEHTCEVVQTDEGLRYRLADGSEHKSPSSAGKAITGGACNGWVFWSILGTEKPKREPKVKAEKPTKAPSKKEAAKKSGRPKKAKSARMASDASYGCGACGKSFPTQKKAIDHALTHTS